MGMFFSIWSERKTRIQCEFVKLSRMFQNWWRFCWWLIMYTIDRFVSGVVSFLTRISNWTRSKWKLICGFVPERTAVQIKILWHSVPWKKESGLMSDLDATMNIRSRIWRGGLIDEIACENWVTARRRITRPFEKIEWEKLLFLKRAGSYISSKNQCYTSQISGFWDVWWSAGWNFWSSSP
jgi:hypothetical protein